MGKVITTHRLAWEFTSGEIPQKLHVLHHCDNPPCCNPKHLFLGTQADNNRDRDAKKRARYRGMKGEDHPQAILTEAAVLTIRSSTKSNAALADEFGVTPTAIDYARRRKTWKHVT